MSEAGIVSIVLAIIAQFGVLVLGYWAYRKATRVVAEATTAVKEKMEATVQTIEATKLTVEQTAEALAVVQKQTDGHLTAMENLLMEKTQELRDETRALQQETAKVERLTNALHDARNANGDTSRRADDPAP